MRDRRDADGAPITQTHDQGNPPWCYRCGVEWMFIGYESAGGAFGGGHLLRPRCECWRLGTAEAVAAVVGPRPAFKSRHFFPGGATLGPCVFCDLTPELVLDPVFCLVGPSATPPDKPSNTPADIRSELTRALEKAGGLLAEGIDLVPRVSDDDPMATTLLDWCRRVRAFVDGLAP